MPKGKSYKVKKVKRMKKKGGSKKIKLGGRGSYNKLRKWDG